MEVDNVIIDVDQFNIEEAAKIHSISWKESHRAFCNVDFINKHTSKHQKEYIQKKINNGYQFYMLIADIPVGIISISSESVIEDLYVLPNKQNKGFGSQLLRFAISKCTACPRLWILENNTDARRLYERVGFHPTGKVNRGIGKLDEIELALT